MLKFEVWPPKPGKVHWTEMQTVKLTNYHGVMEDDFAHGERELTSIASHTGSILVAKIEGDNRTSIVMQIADELSEGWSEQSKSLFVYQVGYGAGLVREEIEAMV